MIEALKKPHWKGLLFANLVDTDMLYGHRNDPEGFARCLEAFDQRLPEILRLLGERGMLIITADHGCDPTTPGTDHTRESVPGSGVGPGLAGRRESWCARHVRGCFGHHFGGAGRQGPAGWRILLFANPPVKFVYYA